MMTDVEHRNLRALLFAWGGLHSAYSSNDHATLAKARQDLAVAWRAVDEDAIEALKMLREV